MLRISIKFHGPAAYVQSLIPREVAREAELSSMAFSIEKITGLH